MENEIKIQRFTGMQNIKDSGSLFVKEGVAEPRIILNSDVTNRGRLKKRDGYTKMVSLTEPHSMWAGDTCHLCVSGGTLYQIENDSATSRGTVTGDTLYYAEVGDKVYLSSKSYNGIFDPDTGSISSWGIDLPDGPMLTSTTGSLEAGTYHVCLTTENDDEISGNGPISQITLSAEGGISISNRGSNDIVWCTDSNGDIFYRVGSVDTIVTIPSVEPLPSLFCYPPPYLQYLTHAFGRMWGSINNKVYYSEPFKWAWWKKGTSFFEFATNVTMIAKTKTGLFIGCEDRTHCLLGTKPEEMQNLDVGSGAIPGTLAYCNNIIELGDTISPPEKKHESVPVWVSEEGIVAGNPVGRLFSLSQGKVKFSPGKEGASLYRQKNGDFQFLTSFYNGPDESSIGINDDATVTVIRNGTVI
jgi:hypothetical protein